MKSCHTSKRRNAILMAPHVLAVMGTLVTAPAVFAQTAAPRTPPPSATTVQPQTPPPPSATAAEPVPDPVPQPPTTQDEANGQDIVVTGFRAAADDALAIKRDNVGFTDTISSEGLDRFPDLNVGEALTRIPGIQINREAGSRDATVNLRGLPGSFAIVTLNGLAFGDPVLEGSTPLGAFNSDIFSRFTVIKSPSPAEQAGGLSGIIDLRINNALSRKAGGFVKLSGEYNDLGNRKTPAATYGYNAKLSPDFAVYGVFTAKKESFRRDSININNYNLLTTTTTPNLAALFGEYYAPQGAAAPGEVALVGGTGTKSRFGVQYPSNLRQSVKDNKGKLITGAAGAEWRITEGLTTAINGFYTRRSLTDAITDILTLGTVTNAGATSALIVPDAATVFSTPDGRSYIDGYSYTNASLSGGTRDEKSVQETYGINPSIEWKTDDWRISANGMYSKAFNTFDQVQIASTTNPGTRTVALPAGNGLIGSVFSGSGDVRDLAYSVSPDNPLQVPGPVIRPATPFDGQELIRSTTSSRFIQLTGTYSASNNTVKSGQVDIERFTGGGFLKSIQAGARYEDNEYVSRGFRVSAIGAKTQNIVPEFIIQSPYAFDFFGDKIPNIITGNWQTTDLDLIIPALKPDPNTPLLPGQFFTPNRFINNNVDNSYLLFNFTNANKVYSAYAMAKIDTELFGLTARGNIGGRFERTENTVIALDRVGITRPNVLPTQRFNTFERKYNKFLPSGLFAVDLTDRLLFRVAGYKTYVRPQRRELSPVTAVSSVTGTGSTTANVSIGNVNIKPYTAISGDIALEWFNRKGSLIAVNYYIKRINDYIAPINDTRISCPESGLFNGEDFGLGTLVFNQVTRECRSTLPDPAGNPLVVNATGFLNNATPVTVKGLEVNIQQNLDFLSGFFRNFGGSVNFSHTDISGKTSGGADIVLNGVSKNNYNFIGYYETKAFGIRAIYNYRDEYELASTGTFSGAARSARARGQLDISTALRFKGGISLGLDAFNLTNELREEFEQVDRVLRRSDYDGRTFVLTVRAPF